MSNSLPIEVLSYDDLRPRAVAFLRKHNPKGTIPVPIEEITEFGLGVAFDVRASLRDACDVDAFISADCTVIYIDSGVWLSPNANRLRFSIAHEVSHALLHRPVMAMLAFKTMQEWKQVYQAIPEDEHGWMEFQANSLAGLILVPPDHLKTQFLAVCAAHKHNPAKLGDAERYVVEETLAKIFSVSHDVIERRISKDGLIKAGA